MTKIIVIAKSPVPGRVKTRLCPPCTPDEAAEIAQAALVDTLRAAAHVATTVVALDGQPGAWLPPDVGVVSQRGGSLDKRIAAAFEDAGAPALLIGMDTPHVSADLLSNSIEALQQADAVLGAAEDGGWWIAGLQRSDPRAFVGVPMSKRFTHEAQLRRMHALGLRIEAVPILRDVDTFDDALCVAAQAPETRFAAAVNAVAEAVSA
ncbi:MAG TPA: TIGR04282 family arsenosugar biosynthesis glycosyltransferase [Actinomycetota bacterium]|jgi:rSAM/selenodomain-associated transferase 1|nr:TIGR04282 family arsenosugar biosynthesis glycosyltransferase [Actinomycetota bacterium]